MTKQVITYNKPEVDASTDRFLNDLQLGRDVLVSFNLSSEASVLPYTFTTEPGANPKEIENYGKREAQITLEDTEVRFANVSGFSDGKPLGAGDYEIASVTVPVPGFQHWNQPDLFNDWRWYGGGIREIENEFSTQVELYGCPNVEGSEWTRYALRSGVYAGTLQAENGATASGSTITLPEGVLRLRFVITTRQHKVTFAPRVTVRFLGDSEFVRTVAEDSLSGDAIYAVQPVFNGSCMDLYEKSGEEMVKKNLPWELLQRTSLAKGYIHGRNYRSGAYLNKRFTWEQDSENSRLVMTSIGTMTQQSNILDRTTYDKEVADGLPCSTAGTWYDLLPAGVAPDLESIQASSGTVDLAYVKENYKGSGRTLLVVHVTYDGPNLSNVNYTDQSSYPNGNPNSAFGADLPRQGFKNTQTIRFTSYYPYSELIAYMNDASVLTSEGLTLRNLMAYEADPQLVDGEPVYGVGNLVGYEGEPDDPNGSMNLHSSQQYNVTGEMALMTDLDANRDDGSFVYAVGSCDLRDAVVATQNLLKKGVSVDGQNWYYNPTVASSDKLAVYEGAIYTYSLQLTTQAGQSTSGIVFYDDLEDGVPNLDVTDDVGAPSWRGSLVDLDLSQLAAKGVDPKVYYALEEVDLTRKPDLSAEPWTDVRPEDLSLVKALAVDASKGTDGLDYELKPGDYLAVYLTMRAPLEDEEHPFLFTTVGDATDPVNNAHAFNTIYVYNETGGYFRSNSYTKLGILPFELKVTKNWDDADNNDGLRPRSITLRLFANGEDTGKTLTMTEESNGTSDYNVWEGGFAHVRKFDDNGDWIEYSVQEDPIMDGETLLYSTSVSSEITNNNVLSFTIDNKHEKNLISVPFEKIWEGEHGYTGDRPDTITVRLLRDGVYTGQSRIVRETDGWRGQFVNLQQFHNMETVDDLGNPVVVHGVPYNYTVQESFVYKYITGYANNNSYANDQPAEGVERNEQTQPRQIVNSYWPYGDLTVEKQLTDSATDSAREQEFSFTLFLTDEDGNPLQDRYFYARFAADGTTVLDESGAVLTEPLHFDNNGIDLPFTGVVGNTGVFGLRQDESVHIYNLPSEARYRIQEAEKAGFILSESEGSTAQIRAGQQFYASFTNAYSAQGSATVSLNKELTAHEQGRYQFSFTLQGVNNQQNDEDQCGEAQDQILIYAQSLPDASNARLSTATFPLLNYTEADVGRTYTYLITEDQPDPIPAGYSYDTRSYLASVTVSDPRGDGRLEPQVSYSLNGEPADQVFFLNHYEAQGLWEPLAYKQLQGRELQREEFSFTLYDEQGNALETVSNDPLTGDAAADAEAADGVVKFSPIHYYQKATDPQDTVEDVGKTFLYVVKENPGTDPTVVYDRQLMGFAVTVTDKNNGKLSCDARRVPVEWDETAGKYVVADGEAGLPMFTNTLNPGTLNITKYTTHASGTQPNAGQEFKFRIKFTGEDIPETIDYSIEAVENDTALIDTTSAAGSHSLTEPAAAISLPERYSVQVLPADGEETLDGASDPREMEEAPEAAAGPGAPAPREAGSLHSAPAIRGSISIRPLLNKAAFVIPQRTGVMATDEPTRSGDVSISGLIVQAVASQAENGQVKYIAIGDIEKMLNNDGSLVWRELWDDLLSYDLVFQYEEEYGVMVRKLLSDPEFAEDLGIEVKRYPISDSITASIVELVDWYGDSTPFLFIWRDDGEPVPMHRDCSAMFKSMTKLEVVEFSGVKFSDVENVSEMFSGCVALRDAVGIQDLASVTDFSKMFYNCESLGGLNVSYSDLRTYFSSGNATLLNGWWTRTNEQTKFRLKMGDDFWGDVDFNDRVLSIVGDKANVKHIIFDYTDNYAFVIRGLASAIVDEQDAGTIKLYWKPETQTAYVLSDGIIYANEYCTNLFKGWTGLESAVFNNFNTTEVVGMASMFENCSSLIELDLSAWTTENVVDFDYMFKDCLSLEKLDLLSFKVASTIAHSGGGGRDSAPYLPGSSSLRSSFDDRSVGTTRMPNVDAITAASPVDPFTEAVGMFINCDALARIRVGTNFQFTSSMDMPKYDSQWWKETDPSLRGDYLYQIWQNITTAQCDGWWVRDASSYSVTFSKGDQPNATIYNQTLNNPVGSELVIPADNIFLPGYRVVKWTDGNGNEYPVAEDGSCTIPANQYHAGDEVTLTAVWEKLGGSAQVQNGEIVITLRGGERAVFENLPASMGYQIVEIYTGDGETVLGETPPGWTLAEKYRDSGTIPAGNDPAYPNGIFADFLNHYEAGRTSGSISALKTLDGKPAESGAFQFTLTETGRPGGAQAHPAQTVTNGAGGLVSFESMTYQVVGTYKYTITETGNWHQGQSDDTIRYDGSTEYITVTVSDLGDGNLSAQVSYDANGTDGDEGAVFANSTKPGALRLTKLEENANKPFTFHIALRTPEGAPYTPAALPTGVSGSEGEFTVALSHEQTVLFADLPAGTQYAISEDAQDGWRMKSVSGSLNGTIPANAEAAVVVTNIYAVGPGGGASTFAYAAAHKRLENGELQAGQFRFTLTELAHPAGASSLSAPLTAENGMLQAAMGEEDQDPWANSAPVRFEAITFDTPGSYAYRIDEVSGTDPTIVYSTETRYVWIQITDNEHGLLIPQVKYSNGADSWADSAFWTGTAWTEDSSWSAESDHEPLFTNRMSPGNLRISKELVDATELAAAQSFSFTLSLRDAQGEVIGGSFTYELRNSDDTAVLNGAGVPVTGTIASGGSLTLQGGQVILVKDLPHGAVYTVEEADNDHGFRLEEQSGETGTIRAAQTEEACFVNRYESVGSAEILVTKSFLGGAVQPEQFQVLLTGTDGVEKRAYLTPDPTNSENGSFTFLMDYTLSDNGQTYLYTITEIIDEDDESVVYDTHSETVSVRVADNGQGQMLTTVSYLDGTAPEGSSDPVYSDQRAHFVNVKRFTLIIGKYVTGNLASRVRDFPVVLTLTQGAEKTPYDLGMLPSGWTSDETDPGVYRFTLRHGKFVSLTLPADVEFSVSEDPINYSPSFELTNPEGTILANGQVGEYLNGSFSRENGDLTLTFTNHLEAPVPTRARLGYGGGAFLAASLAGLGLLLVSRKRRKARGDCA